MREFRYQDQRACTTSQPNFSFRVSISNWITRHRSVLVRPGSAGVYWARTYTSIFDIYKLILVEPSKIDLSSITDEMTRAFRAIRCRGPLEWPLLWLAKVHPGIPNMPLITGLGNKLFWTSGPNTKDGLGSLAMVKEDAMAWLRWAIPMELRFMDHLFLPSVRFPGPPFIVYPGKGPHGLWKLPGSHYRRTSSPSGPLSDGEVRVKGRARW